jgi:hypothetical protein
MALSAFVGRILGPSSFPYRPPGYISPLSSPVFPSIKIG